MKRIVGVLVLFLWSSVAAAQPLQPVQILHQFTTSPSVPDGGLLQVPDGSFYGVTSDTIYRLATNGQVTIAARFTDAVGATGMLVAGAGGVLYGTTQWGGDGGQGTVFRFDSASGVLSTLHAFSGFHEGTSPFGGLALAGGQLYGVTRQTVFRTDPSSGATTILYTFGEGTLGLYNPTSGLTAGADGLLYGTTRTGPGVSPNLGLGALYRLNPATGVVSVAHAFTDINSPDGRLLLGPDNRLYGSAMGGPGLPGIGVGGIYRFDPAIDAYEVLHQLPQSSSVIAPGPLVMTPDGSLYGVTLGEAMNIVPALVSTLFRLRPNGGSYIYEVLRTFDFATTGVSSRAELVRGVDGLIYGYAKQGGAVGAGTLYRFDPAAGGPPSDPLSFTVLHQFVPTTTWMPSAPVAGPDGLLLFGTTSQGGSAQRGAIYALDPTTGAVTIRASIPGTPPGTWRTANTSLIVGADNALYGTTTAATTTADEHGIVRFESAGNAVTNVLNSTVPATGGGPYRFPRPDSTLVRAPTGDLYFVREKTLYRRATNGTVTAAGTGGVGSEQLAPVLGPPVVGGDGRVYVMISTVVDQPSSPTPFIRITRIFRANAATDTLDEVANLGSLQAGSLVPAPGGGLYFTTSGGTSADVRRLDPATGTQTAVCGSSAIGVLSSITPFEGAIVGYSYTDARQRLFVCQPSTGATEIRMLPPSIGIFREPLVAIGGFLYGATGDALVARSWGVASPTPRQPGGALVRFTLAGPQPLIDSDADGLSNLKETAYGLDPFDATGDDGAAGDPDGDGRTNAQELADGTHPRGVLTRYFAEGATGPFFRTRLDIGNPDDGRAATVLVRFLTDTGARISHSVLVPPGSHNSLDPSTVAGLENVAFSTVVEADLTVAVDRTMSWDPSGYGSHIETGVVAPATTWYLAEGSTSGPFALFYLLQNPQATAVDATVRYLRPFGLPPIEKVYTLAPFSRRTIVVDGEGAELASTDLSAVITAALPIVAERAMYYSQPNQAFAAGHESAGVTAPALEWFLAEGATGTFFDLFVLIANPNPSAATVEVEYLLVGGGTLTKTYTVAGNSRSTIWVDDEQLPAGSGQRPLANASLSMTVRSTNAVPIVVERTMWWPGPALTANYWYEAHNSPGATATATRWVVAGAESGVASGTQTYLLIANPGTSPGQARLSYLTADGHQHTGGPIDLPAKSRTSVQVSYPSASDQRSFSVLVESLGTVPVPIVVEHATYSSPGGVLWGSGGNALAAPLP